METNPFLTGPINNEVDFCRAYDLDTKRNIEKILTENQIFYFCRFEDRGFLWRLFHPGQSSACVFRIHDREVDRARELLRSVLGESNHHKKEGKK